MHTFDHEVGRQRIVAGQDSLDRLGDVIADVGVRRPFILSGSSPSASSVTEVVLEGISGLDSARSDGVPRHAPIDAVRALVDAVGGHDADVIIAIGGGSVIDAAKGIALALGEQRDLLELCTTFSIENGLSNPVTAVAKIPVVAIPTTLSGSDVTPGGSTTTSDGVKRSYWDRQVVPRAVFLDPRTLRDAPDAVLLPSAMNALAHAVEAMYSRVRDPFSSALAVQGTRYIARGLASRRAGGGDDAHLDLLIGSALAGRSIASARVGLHHAFCHAIGAYTGIDHGLANTVMLAPTMAFNYVASQAEQDEFASTLASSFATRWNEVVGADGPRSRLAELESRRGGEQPVTDVVAHDVVRLLVADLELPSRLRDVGVSQAALDEIASRVSTIRGVHFNPRAVTDTSQLLSVLEQAW